MSPMNIVIDVDVDIDLLLVLSWSHQLSHLQFISMLEREREREKKKRKREREKEGERESGGEREKELSCKKKWSVINFLQNESWSPKLKIEETEKNVNEDDQRTEKQLLLASTKNAFLWSREKLESTKRSKLKWTEIQGIAL